MAKTTAATTSNSKADQIAALSAMLNVTDTKPTASVATGDFQKKTASKATASLTLSMGVLAFPVKAYKATDVDTVSFNQVHSTCLSKLSRPKSDNGGVEMFCSCCDTKVSGDQIAKGYEFEKGKFVTVTQDELDGCKASADDQLTVEKFVNSSSIDPIYFESTHFLAPDKGGEMQFALLRAGMVEKDKVAIAHFAAKGREQTVVIRPFGEKGLVMHYMFFEYEVRAFAGWDKVPAATTLNDKFLAVAGQLVETMTEDFAPETMGDSYLVNVRKLISAKANGVAAPVVTVAPKVDPSTDLLAALAASLDSAKAKKAAKKVA